MNKTKYSEIYDRIIRKEISLENFLSWLDSLEESWYEQGFLDNLLEEK